MTLASVQGQPRAMDALQSALRSGSVHHAYLFAGPEGVGKELAAVGLAQALTCPEAPEVGCGRCASCVRLAKGLHPDVTWVMPDDERVSRGLAGRSDFTGTPSRELRVEQVRQLQERLALRGLESKRKVAILVSAEQMNVQAQNAFLKTLEEPPAETTLILVASAMDRLLPTIRSRCSKVYFGPLPVDLVARHVQQERKLDADTAALAAVMSGGSLGRALALDVDALKERKDVLTAFEGLRGDDIPALLRFAEAHGGSREDADTALELLILWTRDVSLAKAGALEALANRDLTALAQEAAKRTSEAALHRRHSLLESARTAIGSRNGAPRLQLERLLIELCVEGR
ncbi:DNA polymerase III subunit delta' [Corallococcus interemptor]|uniref:DNA polymerase III subunit delta' n=1 Tax=Corallococcus TaxID=83461 RepID=UPI001CC16A41|nr:MULTISPECIES: DNA polymerase III subunit delta' [unclassified Corallococcus]MBZ4333808.1 DNA polymerase III subunit delta' [Corallococcus sp. AS-1-12]MBZ4370818.1 DNA polymerase III subunit delta' [Corallococcus sp. AS-1-6]